MHCKFKSILAVTLVFFLIAVVHAAAADSNAPEFTGTDSNGQTHKLSDYRGKFVVLEWTNNGCPYTQRHYNSSNMQSLQKEWTSKGVIWLTIISSAPGKQGFMTSSEENAYIAKVHATPTAAILDPNGTIARLYGAKTTPHMFVIDPSGKLIYEGAIDGNPTADSADTNFSKNYVSDALTQSMAGKPVSVSNTHAYGCSVKYSNTP
jgi:thioredoxin-related protein